MASELLARCLPCSLLPCWSLESASFMNDDGDSSQECLLLVLHGLWWWREDWTCVRITLTCTRILQKKESPEYCKAKKNPLWLPIALMQKKEESAASHNTGVSDAKGKSCRKETIIHVCYTFQQRPNHFLNKTWHKKKKKKKKKKFCISGCWSSQNETNPARKAARKKQIFPESRTVLTRFKSETTRSTSPLHPS